jgi:hypothetical protein
MVIGKLYKTVTSNKTFSVSKINELISLFFTLMWGLNLLSQLFNNHFDFSGEIDYKILLPLIITLYISYQMFFGKGRGRFKKREINLYRRMIKIK